MQLAPMQIAVDYEKPEEFAAKLRVAAACHPVAFTVPAKFGLMVAHRLDEADRAGAKLDEVMFSVRGRMMDLHADHDRQMARYYHLVGVVLAFGLAAAVVDFAKAVLL